VANISAPEILTFMSEHSHLGVITFRGPRSVGKRIGSALLRFDVG
jgi:hypothetical protein